MIATQVISKKLKVSLTWSLANSYRLLPIQHVHVGVHIRTRRIAAIYIGVHYAHERDILPVCALAI